MATDRETQLLQDASAAGMTSRTELANFMAQVGHESNGLSRLEEGFRYTRGISQIPVTSAWRQGEEALESARLEALRGKPEQLAELMYGGRMGNDAPGDGYKYRGRGYMQLTGKENYEQAGQALGLDLKNHPDLASVPANASKIAVWYWETRVPESAREDVKAATKAVNGGYNGLEDRRERFASWEKRLTPEVMERLPGTEGGLSTEMSRAPNAVTDGVYRQGENGESIRGMQNQLNQLGYRDAQGRALAADGDFGDRTQQALLVFQQAQGLKADGIAGPQTLDALKKAEQTPLLSNPNHQDHELYKQSYEQLKKLDPAALGFASDRDYQNAAASMAFEAKICGFKRVDHVVSSANGAGLIAVQGELSDPAHSRLYVDKALAAAQPLEQSSAQLQQESQQQPRQQQLTEQREHDQRRVSMA